jgi:uncharacterized protein with HEPN domain
MAARSIVLRLTDIVEAIERVRHVLQALSIEAFESDWERQWLVERGVEIISEASRHLTPELKARHPVSGFRFPPVSGDSALIPVSGDSALIRRGFR